MVINQGERLPREASISFQGGTSPFRALQHEKFRSINLLITTTFVFTTYLMSGRLETKDDYFRGRDRQKVKNH